MDWANLGNLLKSINWLNLIFKISALSFSVGYFVYTLIYYQQLNKMAKNALTYEYLLNDPEQTQKPTRSLLYALALLQMVFALSLIILSLIFL